ncbi:LysR family transcriptional regulator [Nannocystaceae bacterium ST9]
MLLAIHRQRSFLAAGRALGMSTSTTSRRIDALEAALGRTLVKRGRSGTEVEPDALPLIRLAEDLEHGLGVARRDAHSLAGTVKVSVPEGAVREASEALLALRREHPEIEIELLGENRLSDIAKREADVGVRTGRSSSRVLVEKHVGTFRLSLYASAEYVQRNLPTRKLGKHDAARHPFIGLDSRWKDLPHERWMVSLGATRFPFRSSSVAAIVEAATQGAGIAALVDQVGRNAGLVRIDVDVAGPTQPFYLVYHRELRKVPRIRAVVAAMEAYLRAY